MPEIPEFPAKVEVDQEAFAAVKKAIRRENPRSPYFWLRQVRLLFSRRS